MKAGAYYTGFDPNPQAIEGIEKMAEFLDLPIPSILNGPFESAGIGEGSFDVVFTSPPYYRKELYFGQEQSHEKYQTYDEWREGFLKPLVDKSMLALKVGGSLIINVGDYIGCPIKEDTKRFMMEHGEVRHVPLRYRRMFNKKGDVLSRDEAIFVVSKK
jgi:DNA modification methylase